ncbi:heme exporter protein CcmD [Salinarimonas chemoclinalis]|uniref:heme exporter protein CcmD n=1 Tax=Salinarimonas chemoclinalis TaxID=3241599 RepID=UPI0035575B40
MGDPHTPFILASYLATVLVIGGLIARMILDQRAQKRALAELEARGAGRGRRRGEERAAGSPSQATAERPATTERA